MLNIGLLSSNLLDLFNFGILTHEVIVTRSLNLDCYLPPTKTFSGHLHWHDMNKVRKMFV